MGYCGESTTILERASQLVFSTYDLIVVDIRWPLYGTKGKRLIIIYQILRREKRPKCCEITDFLTDSFAAINKMIQYSSHLDLYKSILRRDSYTPSNIKGSLCS
ncbi:hypothetical protein JTB14_004773 [Gonioctena quinquepunctata]|nr:hypothetical protein JTB14_004773 [Gonioctena quinquepunctata]